MPVSRKQCLPILFVAALALSGDCEQRASGFLLTTKPLDVGIPQQPLCIAVTSDIPPQISYWDPGTDCSTRNSSVGTAEVVSISKPDTTSLLVDLRIPQHVGVADVTLRITPSSILCVGTGAQQTAQRRMSIPPGL